MTETGLAIDRERCDACGKCIEACPSGAREMIGRTISGEELLVELIKDRAYYEKSGGGVTLSGGEPTFQADFAEELLHGLKEQGISTALDTCGLTSTHTFDRLLPYTDLMLFDIKLLDPTLHREFTGASNRQILENLAHVHKIIQHQPGGVELWIRTPLIPGATDTNENLAAIGCYLTQHLGGAIARWELCAFNNLCREQYIRLGLEWKYASTPLMSTTDIQRCDKVAKANFFRPDLVLVTGVTRQEESLQE